MPRPARKAPRDRVDWPSSLIESPDGPSGTGESFDFVSDDPALHVAVWLAFNVRNALVAAGLSYRAAQERTGVNHTTIGDIVRGATWPDAETIARLEAGLGVDLWPARVAPRLGVVTTLRGMVQERSVDG